MARTIITLIFITLLITLGISLDVGVPSSIKVPSRPLTVILNGEQVQLELSEDVDDSAHQFCLKHELSSSDCRTLKNHIRNLPQSSDSKTETKDNQSPLTNSDDKEKNSKPEVIDEVENTVSGMAPSASTHVEEHQMNRRTIDYSKKEGPKMDVYHDGVMKFIQTYMNETPQQAVKRFCKKHQLIDHQCDTVRTAFLDLYGGEKDEMASLSPRSLVDKSVEEPKKWLIAPYIWDTYIYPLIHIISVLLVMGVYLMQWRDEVVEERVRQLD